MNKITREHVRQVSAKLQIDEALRDAGLHKILVVGGRTAHSPYHAQAETPRGAVIDFTGSFTQVMEQIAEYRQKK